MRKIIIVAVVAAGLFTAACKSAPKAHDMDMHHQQHAGNVNNYFAQVMDDMMKEMSLDNPQCCVSVNFLAQMMPHHLAAVDMARYELKYGKNRQMLNLAQRIITEQTSELKTMDALLKYYKKDNSGKTGLPQGYVKDMDAVMTKMMEDMPHNLNAMDTDRAFAAAMIPHHQAAIDMADVLLKYTTDKRLIRLADGIITTQRAEIKEMREFLKHGNTLAAK